MLDPIRAEVAGDDEAEGVAVEHRQVFAVHGPGEHDLAVEGVVDVEGLDEIGGACEEAVVKAFEGDLAGVFARPALSEEGADGNAGPAGVAHGAVAELAAVDAGVEVAAAVAGALVDGGEFDGWGEALEVGEGKLERGVHFAADAEAKGCGGDAGGMGAEMVADEERVVGGEQAVGENGQGRLQLGRTAGEENERAFCG